MSSFNQRWPVGLPVAVGKSLDSSEWEVTLKDGTKIDARVALADLRVLRSVLSENPVLLERLVGMAKNDGQAGDETTQDFCDDCGLRPTVKAILLNSASVEKERLVLGDPFMTLEQDADVAANNQHVLNTASEARSIGIERLFAELEASRRGDGKGPSR